MRWIIWYALCLATLLRVFAGDHHRRVKVHRSTNSTFPQHAYAATQNLSLEKRFDGCRITYYDVGLGACGDTNAPSEFVVAMNPTQFENGENCFKTASIRINGKTTTARVVDKCPGCPDCGIDMSTGLFSFFADLGEGVLTGEWEFVGASSDGPSSIAINSQSSTAFTNQPSTSTPALNATPAVNAAPAPTATGPSPTTQHTSPSSTLELNTGVASGLAVATGSGPDSTGVLVMLNMAVIGMGSVVVAGDQARGH